MIYEVICLIVISGVIGMIISGIYFSEKHFNEKLSLEHKMFKYSVDKCHLENKIENLIRENEELKEKLIQNNEILCDKFKEDIE